MLSTRKQSARAHQSMSGVLRPPIVEGHSRKLMKVLALRILEGWEVANSRWRHCGTGVLEWMILTCYEDNRSAFRSI